jgi:hypothetical protein
MNIEVVVYRAEGPYIESQDFVLMLRLSGPNGQHIQCHWAKATGLRLSTTRGPKGRHTGNYVGPPGLDCCALLTPVVHAQWQRVYRASSPLEMRNI